MKTIQELYSEVMNNQELKEKFIEAAKDGKQEAFLKEHGCEATLEEVKAFLEAKAKEDAPLSLGELENAAGGKCSKEEKEITLSICGLGIGCALVVLESASIGHVGKKNIEDTGRLCSTTSIFD
ncbi:MAG: hypothetical protein IKO25_02150 [Clostridia bacterium]|nr:hypothetical protein [Clostridia bacterium]